MADHNIVAAVYDAQTGAEPSVGELHRSGFGIKKLSILTKNGAARKLQRVRNPEDEPLANSEFEGIIGRSPQMWEMHSRIRRVAPHYRALLITGETGTGKDLVARAIHKLSPAASGRYVVVNCSALVETLFESELFGHVRGSFTGATHDKLGLIEYAHGGTLFLDEIGDMPLTAQAKLLRVLQNREVQRVGALSSRKVNLRVIAATNHDLRALIAEKRFREDLFYRLSMVEILVPRLAERKKDLPLLQRHFISRFAAEYKKEIHGLTHRTQLRLSQHSWPGHVRELENVIGHAAMMTMGDMIDLPDLPPYLRANSERGDDVTPFPPSDMGTFEEQERLLLSRALDAVAGNKSKAARLLRIGRDALRYKVKKHNLEARVSRPVSAVAGR
jgi:transcriptional regulator with PAS, ATPase and Fis domain